MTYRIGQFEFDADTNTLVRGTKSVSLENRTARVLEYLCQNPGRVISKDELLDEVWGRQALSEHSVSIVISDLRKALGDSSKASRIIKTIPKKGYIFNLPESVNAPPPRAKIAKYLLLAAAPVLALLFIFKSSFFGPEQVPTLVYFDLENVAGTNEANAVAETLNEAILVELSKIPELRVVRIRAPEKPLTASLNPFGAFVAQQDLALLGSVSPVGDTFAVTLRLENGESREILWGFSEELVEDYYFISGRRAVDHLAGEMGWQKNVLQAIGNERAERLYWRSVYLWESRTENDTQASHNMLLEALNLEPNFARAHAQLATIYAHKTGPYLGFDTPNLFDRAEEHLAKAEQDGLEIPEVNVGRALISFYRDRDNGAALNYLDQGLEKWTNHALLWHTRAMVLSAMGRHDESLYSVEKALELDPLSHSINWDRVWYLYLAEDFEGALKAAKETAEFTSDVHYYYVALIHEALGNQAEALNSWLNMIEKVGIGLPYDRVSAGEEINYHEKYQILLDAVEADGRRFWPDAVKVFWAYLSGDQARTIEFLETMPVEQENWVFYWLDEIPLLFSLKENEATS